VKPLTRKLLRDLLRLRGQALTIALVVMAGVASWVSLRATFESLTNARESYYERQSFADVFADCSRAPAALLPRLQVIDGVTRVTETALAPIRMRMPQSTTPPTGVLVGLKPGGPTVDIPRVMSGRLPQPGSTEEGTVLDAFAKAHSLQRGDFIDVVVAGSERRIRVVGTAVSPEYLFAIAPGDMTGDEKRFGVIWMDLDAVRKLENLPAAFNHVSLSLSPSANETQVIAEVDALLAPYGGVGAFGRSEQPSNRMLSQELTQLRGMALITPSIFLAVAAFLLNAVLGRLITLERPEIAALRALGYTGREVALHYLQLVLAITIETFADATLVPIGALFRKGPATATFVVDAEGFARERTLELLGQGERDAAIASGIQPGDRVVLHPSDRIKDGTRVEPRQ
jgi:putative ABC transport system permease protein